MDSTMASSTAAAMSPLRLSVRPGTPGPVAVDTKQLLKNHKILSGTTTLMREYVVAGAQPDSVLETLKPQRVYDTMEFTSNTPRGSSVTNIKALLTKHDTHTTKRIGKPVNMDKLLNRVRYPWDPNAPRVKTPKVDWTVRNSRKAEFELSDFNTPIPVFDPYKNNKSKYLNESKLSKNSSKSDSKTGSINGGTSYANSSSSLQSTPSQVTGVRGGENHLSDPYAEEVVSPSSISLSGQSTTSIKSNASSLQSCISVVDSTHERPSSVSKSSFLNVGEGPHGRFPETHSKEDLISRGISQGTIFRPKYVDYTYGGLEYRNKIKQENPSTIGGTYHTSLSPCSSASSSSRRYDHTKHMNFNLDYYHSYDNKTFNTLETSSSSSNHSTTKNQNKNVIQQNKNHFQSKGKMAATFFESHDSFGAHENAFKFIHSWKLENNIYTPIKQKKWSTVSLSSKQGNSKKNLKNINVNEELSEASSNSSSDNDGDVDFNDDDDGKDI